MTLKDLLKDAYKSGMTLEEVEAALSEIPDSASEISKLKSALTNSNSEAAKYKKQLQEKMTEDEKVKQAEKERFEKLQSNYDTLLRESTVAKHTAKYIALGYDRELAEKSAAALADGDFETVFANEEIHRKAAEKALKDQLLQQIPSPVGGQTSNAVDYTKKAEQAMAAGNTAEAAYYTRLASETNAEK